MTEHKFIFIGGLHRSGTSLLANILKQHPDISSFKNTGFPEDEGQFLQTVYPIAKIYGGPGKFAFKNEMHLTERSDLLTEENKRKIFEEWSKYWDLEKKILLEKSPPNLIKMRFLQSVFPNAYFLIMVRDPLSVSMATKKWSDSPVDEMIKHWVIAHDIYYKDKQYINKILQIKYEDLIMKPPKVIKAITSFLEIEDLELSTEIRSGINEEYKIRYISELKKKNIINRYIFKIKGVFFEKSFRRIGYSFKNIYKV